MTTATLQLGAVVAKPMAFVLMRETRSVVFGIQRIARPYIAADPELGKIFLARWSFVTCAATGHSGHRFAVMTTNALRMTRSGRIQHKTFGINHMTFTARRLYNVVEMVHLNVILADARKRCIGFRTQPRHRRHTRG